MVYLVDVVECFLLKDYSKLFCYAIATDGDGDGEGYLAVIKVDRFYETTLDELPENVREIVETMIEKEDD